MHSRNFNESLQRPLTINVSVHRTADTLQKAETAANTDLTSLISHREWVSADLSLGDFVKRLNQTSVSYVAVQDESRVVGVVSRETIGLLFGGPFGFALFATDPVTS